MSDDAVHGFLRRWSRRKQAARARPEGDEPPAPPTTLPGERPDAVAAVPAEHAARPPGDAPAAAPPELPDLETLTVESDFRPFMAGNVPEGTRQAALRKLWQVDPVFNMTDGLDDFSGDFTDAATVVPDLKTAYKVGRGFLDDLADKEAAPDTEVRGETLAEAPAEGPAPATGTPESDGEPGDAAARQGDAPHGDPRADTPDPAEGETARRRDG